MELKKISSKKSSGSVDVLIGLQWGDEGKGKIVDVLALGYKAVARFSGGPNAGHTLLIGDKEIILHVIPSGIIRTGLDNFIGNGVVLSPYLLKEEIEGLQKLGLDVKNRLFISIRAHMITPAQVFLDKALEYIKSSKEKIGTTQKGIGPTYESKINRSGLRMEDIFATNLQKRYDKIERDILKRIKSYGVKPSNVDFNLSEEKKKFFEGVKFLRSYEICDVSEKINKYLSMGKSILAEGAQGTLLDIDHGSYPYVTSSNPSIGGVCTGLGVAASSIDKVYGVTKAYTTRVGSGPFPTELDCKIGEKIRKKGREFGATTGRPRRCGWLDLTLLRYAVILNGVTDLVVSKIDVLEKFEKIKLCTYYNPYHNWPPSNLSKVNLKEISFPGWKKSIQESKSVSELPDELIIILNKIQEFCQVNISHISVGAERNQVIEV